MELKLFVSGVPAGENLWGDKSDSPYFGTLYVNSKENMKYDIRLNKSGAKIYAYYHYLVYNSINDFEGRTGSYFGLTIRLDSFCIDFKTIYNILDILYRKKIVGTILKEVNGGRLQYTCPSFYKRDAELVELENSARSMLGTSLSNSDFLNIPSIPSGKGLVRLNWDDASPTNVVQAVGKYAFCSISTEYDSVSVSTRLKEEFKRGAGSRQAEINQLTSEIQDINKKGEALQAELTRLQKPSTIPTYSPSRHEHNHHHHGYDEEKGFFSSLRINDYIIGGLFLTVVIILGYYAFWPDSPEGREGIVSKQEVPQDSVSVVYSIIKEKEQCPEASIQIIKVQESGSDEQISYIVKVNGLDSIPEKKILTSVGNSILTSANEYQVSECPKDSDLIVVFVATKVGDNKPHNLKSTTYKHAK